LRARRPDRRGRRSRSARQRPCRGAALTCFVEEPAKASPLFGTPGFVATPHLGASTSEAQVNVAIQVAEQMADYLMSGGITNALNVPALSAEEAPKLRPYMELANQLGSLVGQLEEAICPASRSRRKARPPRSTRSRSPAPCWRASCNPIRRP
jgi:hypothetical protein